MIYLINFLGLLSALLLFYFFWRLLDKRLRPFLIFLGLVILFIIITMNFTFIDDSKYLEFKKDFYAKNASILKLSNFDEIQQLQNTICASTKLHNNNDFDKKIKEDLKIEFFPGSGNVFKDWLNNQCSVGYIVSYIEKNLNPLQIRNDILFRQYRLDFYSWNISIGPKCAHYNSWGEDDRLALGYNDAPSELFNPFRSKDIEGNHSTPAARKSEHFYNLYQGEYNSLRNFLLEKIKNTELMNNTPSLEKKILGEIVSKNEELNFVNKLNKRFRSQECNFIRDKHREIDLVKKQKDEPIAKKLGRAAKSAKDGVQDAINPLKNKADKLFDQFKDGFND